MSVKPIGTATESEIWQCMSEACHRACSWKASRVPPHAVNKKFSKSWVHCLSLNASIPIHFNPGYRHRRFKYLFSLQRCHPSMRIPFTSAHFFPLFLIPWDPVFSGPLVPFVLAARSAFAFASAIPLAFVRQPWKARKIWTCSLLLQECFVFLVHFALGCLLRCLQRLRLTT